MKWIAALILFIACNSAFAESVTLDSVSFVYELESANSFDFAAGGTHQCGSNLYRVTSNVPESLNRKFSLVLVALTADKSLIVDAGPCQGDRRLVGWVRVYR